MPEATLLAVFIAGLFGGGHCAAMCGGIVGALSSQRRTGISLHLGYNAGRIGSYTAAGAVAGTIGGLMLLGNLLSVRIGLYVVANILLVLVGLYLAGGPGFVTRLEALGRRPWRHISRLTGRVLPADTLPRALAAGAIWGWLPCGLTYSALAIALLSGSALRGASLMAMFGLGTLPNLLAAGLIVTRARPWLQGPVARRIAGGVVLTFGVAGLAHATWLGDQIRRGVLCVL
jgi:sulfite exporter TauE/SafE